VARPVTCWPEHGVVVTARAAGAPLAEFVRRAVRHGTDRNDLARAAAWCTTAGAWLRSFQARAPRERRSGSSPQLHSPQAFLAYLDERLRILTEVHHGVETALHTRLLAHAAATLHAVPPRVFEQVTWSHSDFGPHNVLVDGDALTVIDFELAPQHPAFDAAYFVESLAHRSGPLVDASRVRRLERAFLAGYGEPLDPAMFLLLRLRHLVCSYVSEARRGGVASLRGWPGLVTMRGRLRRFADLLSIRTRARAA
jgi:Ser/Thr protein kinase RdoA (MazF antagonist)